MWGINTNYTLSQSFLDLQKKYIEILEEEIRNLKEEIWLLARKSTTSSSTPWSFSWLRHWDIQIQKSSLKSCAISLCLDVTSIVFEIICSFRGSLILIVVMVFAMASALSTLRFIFFEYAFKLFIDFICTKQMHTCASILLGVKWNIGRISRVPLGAISYAPKSRTYPIIKLFLCWIWYFSKIRRRNKKNPLNEVFIKQIFPVYWISLDSHEIFVNYSDLVMILFLAISFV